MIQANEYSIEQLAEIIETQDGEESADYLAGQLVITDDGVEKTRGVVASFVHSYRGKNPETSNVDWLTQEFSKYPEIWSNSNEAQDAAREIVQRVQVYEDAKQDLQAHFDKGGSRDNWLAKKIEQGASINGVNNVGEYAARIESAIDVANHNNIECIYRKDGLLSQQYNLDGFIAEHHHANTFNINAAAKGSEYRAEVLEHTVNNKNSVDIVIKDGNGKVVKRYQSKYGADSKATEQLFDKGNYRGQRKLVPEGHAEDIQNSVDKIEADGVTSEPISKEQAKEYQRQAQEQAEARRYDWNDANRADIAKTIGKKAAFSVALSVGFQGARILGRRIWNGLRGKPNQSFDDDLEEFVDAAIQSGANTGLTVAVTGGVTVAVKSGWLGKALQGTPVGRIANAVCIGVENVKILYKYAKGEITGEEALDQAGSATCSLVGGLIAGAEAAGVGAVLGAALGPVGSVIGGIAGGIVGGIAGSTVGEAVYHGGKKIVKSAARAVRSLGSTVVSGVKSVGRIIERGVGRIASFFGF